MLLPCCPSNQRQDRRIRCRGQTPGDYLSANAALMVTLFPAAFQLAWSRGGRRSPGAVVHGPRPDGFRFHWAKHHPNWNPTPGAWHPPGRPCRNSPGSRPLLSPPLKVLGRDVESVNGGKCQPAVAKSEQARLGLEFVTTTCHFVLFLETWGHERDTTATSQTAGSAEKSEGY
jgi:hypothetical protein